VLALIIKKSGKPDEYGALKANQVLIWGHFLGTKMYLAGVEG
jgi:hypothetical protein